jgi:hypothetical protein
VTAPARPAPTRTPVTRPRRHGRTGRPAWRRRADALLGGGLVALAVATGAVLWLVTVPVVGSGQALPARDGGDPRQVLILLAGADADGVEEGTKVSVVWGLDGDRVDGTVRALRGPEALSSAGLPAGSVPDDVVVAEAELEPAGTVAAGTPGTATLYVGRRPLVDLFVGRGVER